MTAMYIEIGPSNTKTRAGFLVGVVLRRTEKDNKPKDCVINDSIPRQGLSWQNSSAIDLWNVPFVQSKDYLLSVNKVIFSTHTRINTPSPNPQPVDAAGHSAVS